MSSFGFFQNYLDKKNHFNVEPVCFISCLNYKSNHKITETITWNHLLTKEPSRGFQLEMFKIGHITST